MNSLNFTVYCPKLMPKFVGKYYSKSKNPPIIYCDMDGVLVDLNSGLLKLLNNTILHYNVQPLHIKNLIFKALISLKYKPLTLTHMNISKTTPEIKELAGELIHNNKLFWSNLPWNKEGPQLWNFLSTSYDVRLLTIPVDKLCEEGKKEWAKTHLGLSPERVFFSTKNKGEFAEKNALLIDDSLENIANFHSMNGKAVLFTTFQETFPLLMHYLPY
jgi:5'(3')-deoxyribonucleotidase